MEYSSGKGPKNEGKVLKRRRKMTDYEGFYGQNKRAD
jgi:hypothetical protein